MKNYSIKIAADMLVRRQVQLGLSRHQNPALAREKITSVMTAEAHKSALRQYAKWLLTSRQGKHLKNSNVLDAQAYLQQRAKTKRQSTVDLDRQAINFHLHSDQPLNYLLANVPTVAQNRAYTPRQLSLLVRYASPTLALSIRLAVEAGLRDMEIISIAPFGALKPSVRDWHPHLFFGRQSDTTYSVWGKGGLCRTVKVSVTTAAEIDKKFRSMPILKKNRKANLTSHFDLLGGQEFSKQFGTLSQKVLGFSYGSHGLRHSFAQLRRNALLCLGLTPVEAFTVVSQELGHFSIKNTLAYMRDVL